MSRMEAGSVSSLALLLMIKQMEHLERKDISEFLTKLMSSYHIYYDAWIGAKLEQKELCSVVLDVALDAIDKYDSMELKLSGKAIWLLSMCSIYFESSLFFEKVSNSESISSIIRMLLLFDRANESCLCILHALVKHKTSIIDDICFQGISLLLFNRTSDVYYFIGLSMMDEIQNPLVSTNYATLMSFLLQQLQSNFNEGSAYTIMSFLSKITFHVDYNHKCSYFLFNYVTVLENCLNIFIPSTISNVSPIINTNGVELAAGCRKSISNSSLSGITVSVLSGITSSNIAIYIKTITFIRGIIALHQQNVRCGILYII